MEFKIGQVVIYWNGYAKEWVFHRIEEPWTIDNLYNRPQQYRAVFATQLAILLLDCRRDDRNL